MTGGRARFYAAYSTLAGGARSGELIARRSARGATGVRDVAL